jgi:hypothetical protein
MRVSVDVPNGRVGDLYAAVAKLHEPAEEPPTPAPGATWDENHGKKAVNPLGNLEIQLLWRIADASGARVPIKEIARDFGLPAETALDRDFPGLSAYCASNEPPQPRPAMPVVAGGTDEQAWYRMDPIDGGILREALEDKLYAERA